LFGSTASFMPDCGQMISSQQKIMGGNHDNPTDLSQAGF
jgi:hypothetical protein